jgi:arylsulfatase A-like enzyme
VRRVRRVKAPSTSLLALLAANTLLGSVVAAERPNIVWLMSEDNSKHYLGLFDPAGVETPHIADLAEEGIVFERAFSNASVCSAARTVLITGGHGPRLFTAFHRRAVEARLPEGLEMFPALLRRAGYHTTNRQKKDYNAVESEGTWDESSGRASWRDREDGQPFFHCRTFPSTHEGRLHVGREELTGERLLTDPEGVEVPAYLPDSELMRGSVARYHDLIRGMDDEIGRVVGELREDGLMESAIIFYFGDHGGVLPGSKGHWREAGLHVPLVVRVPERWLGMVPGGEVGVRVGASVSFVDFAPTVLALAGLEVPEAMDGVAFLGEGASWEGRDRAVGYTDRFDEKYDMVRTLRIGDWKYVRRLVPHQPDGLRNNYRFRMLAYAEWRELARAGALEGEAAGFFEARAAESLYDLASDPHEVRDLAGEAGQEERLGAMREELGAVQEAWPDLSYFPESILASEAAGDPVAFGEARRDEIVRLKEVADLALLPFGEARGEIEEVLRGGGAWERWWALAACGSFGAEAAGLEELVRANLEHEHVLVRGRAAEVLGVLGLGDPRPVLLEALGAADDALDALVLLQSVVYVRDHLGLEVAGNEVRVKVRSGEVDRRLEYLGE